MSLKGLPVAIATGGSIFLQIFSVRAWQLCRFLHSCPIGLAARFAGILGEFWADFPDGFMRFSRLLVCNYYHCAFLKFYDIV